MPFAEPERHPYDHMGPERDQRQANVGKLQFPNTFPADPVKDEPTRKMTHRGGAASARTEHY